MQEKHWYIHVYIYIYIKNNNLNTNFRATAGKAVASQPQRAIARFYSVAQHISLSLPLVCLT